jgi:hypothetical protein
MRRGFQGFSRGGDGRSSSSAAIMTDPSDVNRRERLAPEANQRKTSNVADVGFVNKANVPAMGLKGAYG